MKHQKVALPIAIAKEQRACWLSGQQQEHTESYQEEKKRLLLTLVLLHFNGLLMLRLIFRGYLKCLS